ncbi:uncharacterized protein N7483_012175 [Penicillium malachiteum]|uniref:uncharacterized protein n=1 Tax=Penicillium malachiteum TaxID=1324776 RepID=UPI0025496CA1|nr:uncharacterized protein N7483_012175 [Penicillium malachiteum]KAJ5714994.1 hypothetical protein N7483_012175 [Penicillium malachiteum]
MQADRYESVADPSKRSRLLELPNEYIATILPNDKDLLNLGRVCKEANARILAPNAHTWRARFGQKYDIPKGRSSEELFVEYQIRAIVLGQKIDFENRIPRLEQTIWLEVIRTMSLEALLLPLRVGEKSKTFEQLKERIRSVSFLDRPKNSHPSELFYAVQLCLTPLALDPEICVGCHRENYDIDKVYSYTKDPSGPWIEGNNLDLGTLLDIRSFWQRHLLTSNEGTFYKSFLRLTESLKPQFRKTDGSNPTSLCTSWLGYYSCVHPFPSTLADLRRRQTCADLSSHWDQVEMMTLDIVAQSSEWFWPERCNRIIPQSESPSIRAETVYFNGYQRTFGGKCDTANPMFGFVEPIKTAYGGFSGWARICFILCEQVHGTDKSITESPGWVHGYEAVILPGGRMMLGRWLDMKETSARGPFIFWDI